MLTILTEHGNFQYAWNWTVRIREPGKSFYRRKAVEWLGQGDSTGFKFHAGDEIKLPNDGPWTPIIAASWNTAYDRERLARKACREDERLATIASELLEKGLLRLP